MKWTMRKINKLTRVEIISLIEKATNKEILSTSASDTELRQELIIYINKGLV